MLKLSRSLVLVFAAATLIAAEPDAQHPKEKLEELKARLQEATQNKSDLEQKAQAVGSEIDTLGKKLVDAARDIQDREARATDLEGQIAELTAKETEMVSDLKKRRSELANSLAALQRLTQRPPELGIARPDDARAVVQSAELLSAVVPELKKQAADLQVALDKLKVVRSDLKDSRDKLATDLADLAKQRKDMTALLEQRKKQRDTYLSNAKEEEERARQIAKEVTNTQRLIARLDEEAARRLRQKPTPPERVASTGPTGRETERAGSSHQLKSDAQIAALEGTFNSPVAGHIVTLFGQEGPNGPSKGIRFETRDGAQVVAPYDGRVVFNGPFRDYGQLLIIRHADGYHSLLAGMARIDAQTGQWVVAGEPVGVMGSTPGKRGPELYLEIRRDNQAVNPVRWLASRKKKTS